MSHDLIDMEKASAKAFGLAHGIAGVEMVATPELARLETPVPHPAFNSVLWYRGNADAIDDTIADVQRRYAGKPVLWRVGPASTDPARLGERLLAHGFTEGPRSTAMAGRIPHIARLWRVLPFSGTGVRVRNLADYRLWFSVWSAAFAVPAESRPLFEEVASTVGHDHPALRNLVLEVRGEPVATATTLYGPGDRFGALFNVSVRADRRGRGYGKSMLAFAAYDLYKRGCREIGQYSTPMGVPFYRAVGGRVLGEFRNYVWAA